MSSLDRLVVMANQIARNLEVTGTEQAIVDTADHIAKFWDPRMRAMITAHLRDGGDGLSDVARGAVARLAPVAHDK